MKTFLLSLLVSVFCFGANAETRLFPTYSDATSTIKYTVSTSTVEGETYKTVTFNVTNDDVATAFTLYYIYSDKSKYVDCQAVDGPLTVQKKSGLKKVDCYQTLFKTTSNYPEGASLNDSYAFFNASWNPELDNPDAIGSGDWCTLYLSNDAKGKLYVDGAVFDVNKGYNLPYLTIDLDTPTAINAISSNENADAPTYNIAGQRVANSTKGFVIKNGKKYIAK